MCLFNSCTTCSLIYSPFSIAAPVESNSAAEKSSSNGAKASSSDGSKSSSIAEVKAKLKTANAEKPPEMVSLQQEESVSISGSNARLMVMQRLTRKKEVCELVIVMLLYALSLLDYLRKLGNCIFIYKPGPK